MERLPEEPILKEKHEEAMDRVGGISGVGIDNAPGAGATWPSGRDE